MLKCWLSPEGGQGGLGSLGREEASLLFSQQGCGDWKVGEGKGRG